MTDFIRALDFLIDDLFVESVGDDPTHLSFNSEHLRQKRIDYVEAGKADMYSHRHSIEPSTHDVLQEFKRRLLASLEKEK